MKKEKTKLTVDFKSYPENFFKEKSGVKPNTLRQIDTDDLRFYILKRGAADKIRITNTATGEFFIREITDYSEWKGWAVISWQHRE
jgi:hypothetical protein